MLHKNQIFEWDVPQAEVQVGIPVGYEVEFSLKSYFHPILYRVNTFEENTNAPIGVFFYSLDNGLTWNNYPIGETGQTFYSAYKMRLIINASEVSFVFAEKNGTIYRISGDVREIIESYTVKIMSDSDFGIDIGNNSLYVSGSDSTLYKIDTCQSLVAGDNSLNIHSNPLAIAIDGIRNSFWQIDASRLYLKDLLSGDLISTVALPEIISVDYSSSSSSYVENWSSSSTSSSSSSSYIENWSSSSTLSSSSSTSLSSSSSSSSSS